MPAAARRLSGLKPVTLEKLTLNNSTASGLNTTSQTGSVITFSVETTDVRLRDDGTAPTNTTGVLFAAGVGPYYYTGDLSSVQWARAGASGTSTVTVIAYTQPGD